MYLTYAEYQTYGGTLDEASFNDLEFKAECKIDWYTFNRLQKDTTFPEAVKRCMYSVITLLAITFQTAAEPTSPETSLGSAIGGIASQSNDGVSISYNVLSAKDAVEIADRRIEETIKQGLQSVVNSLGQKVLYRGVYPNE